MIIGIFNGKTTISSAFIRCYFHYVLLFKKLCLEFEDDYSKYVNHILNLIKKNNYEITKQIIPDIGNFLMLLFFSNKDTHSDKMKKFWYSIFEESSLRRPYWIFHGDELKAQTRKLILKFQEPLIDDVCIKRFELDDNYDMVNKELFISDLKNADLFEKIIEIVKSDEYINLLLKERYYELNDCLDYHLDITDYLIKTKPFFIAQKIENDFKLLYKECTKETKTKINGILRKLMFSFYFDPKENDGLKDYEEEAEKRNELYDSYRVNELLQDERIENMDEILKFLFDNQKGNKLFIITFFTAKKIEDKDFMKELENNYGIYLDVDTFIKEMNQKLNEITSLHQMYEYIGSEYGKNKTDLEIVIESYEKAKKKGYMGAISNPLRKYYNRGDNDQNGIRGRGGRGGGRGGRGGRNPQGIWRRGH